MLWGGVRIDAERSKFRANKTRIKGPGGHPTAFGEVSISNLAEGKQISPKQVEAVRFRGW